MSGGGEKEKRIFFWLKNVQDFEFDCCYVCLPAFSSFACFCLSPFVGGVVFDVDSIINVLSSARLEFILARRRFSINGLLARFVSTPSIKMSFSNILSILMSDDDGKLSKTYQSQFCLISTNPFLRSLFPRRL